MKRLKAGSVNSISFIRNISYTINSFDVTFEKVVGGTVLTLSELQDELGLAVCSDFIVLNLDLVSNTIEGGEYYMTVTNAGVSTTYLCEVQSYQYNTHGTDIYADSVVLSGDVTGSVAIENTDAVTPEEGGTTSGGDTSGGDSGSTNTDPNYNPNTDPTNSWNGLPLLTWDNVTIELNAGYDADTYILSEQDSVNFFIDNLPSEQGLLYTTGEKTYEVLVTLTDSDNNSFTYTKEFLVDTQNSQYADTRYFSVNNVSEKGLNGGDIATIDVTLSNKNDIKATAQFTLLLTPKVSFYMAESLSDAQAFRAAETDSSSLVELYNDTLTSNLNLYAYVESNKQAIMQYLSFDAYKSHANYATFTNTISQNISPTTFTAPEGQMTEIKANYPHKPVVSSAFSQSEIKLHTQWDVNGVTIDEGLTLFGQLNLYQSDSAIGRKFNIRHTAPTTITLNGNTYNIEAEVPVVLNRPNDPTNKVALNTVYTPNIYELYLGFVIAGGYAANPTGNYFDEGNAGAPGYVRVLTRETYTDGTVIEVENKQLFFNVGATGTRYYYNNYQNGSDPYARVSFSQEDTTKTLDNMVVWFRFKEFGTSNLFYYNVDNGSANSPEFYFEP